MTGTEFRNAVTLGKSRSACHSDHIDGLVKAVRLTRDIPGHIIDYGSYKGGSAIAMAAAAEFYRAPKKVFAFDTFSGMPATSQFDEHSAGDFGDISLEEIRQVTSFLSNLELVVGSHADTVPNYCDGCVSLVFMDSDLYESHLLGLKTFWPIISKGGVFIFHDWNTLDCSGVCKAICEYFGDDTLVSQTKIAGMLTFQKD